MTRAQHQRDCCGLATVYRRRLLLRSAWVLGKIGSREAQRCGVTFEESLNRIAEVLQQVPTVGDLARLRCSAHSPFGVAARAIPRDDLNAGPFHQPSRQRIGGSIGKQVQHAVPLQVNDDRAVCVPLAHGPVINADHPWRRVRFRRHATEQSTQRRSAGGESEVLDRARSGLTAHLHGELRQRDVGASCPTAVRAHDTLQSLGEHGSMARHVGAPEPPHFQIENHQAVRPGQVA